ncbi:MAG: hypothetical protein KAJ19_25570 [Gammaproteobacteria bacterium]|nr:hypothetical protein [Gammaproteobacteria bacterium]
MSLSIDDAREVADMRLKLVQNIRDGKAPEAGIDEDRMKAVLETVRKDRSIGDATNSKAKGKAPTIPIDLDAFMNK